ncbi:hypothetical protein U1769_08490 [Sphingomonas sp. ZT3P38]|uniref:hypothetical protein n=1 Tax=Parasphingomonas zepuensis TaxID=3096161 RepID=UPI002FC90A49
MNSKLVGMAAFGAIAALVTSCPSVRAQASQASGRPANAEENRPVIEAMCRRWQPVMQELMKAEWPALTPQFTVEKRPGSVTFHGNDMDWSNAAPFFEKATERFQPAWRKRRSSDFRRPLIAWMHHVLEAPDGRSKVSMAHAAGVLDYHLRRGKVRVWTVRLPVPFLELNRRYTRYRQVTRIQLDAVKGEVPQRVFDDVLLPHANFYVISDGVLHPEEISPDSAQPAFLFLFRGQPYVLTPYINQIYAPDFDGPWPPPRRYRQYHFSWACSGPGG